MSLELSLRTHGYNRYEIAEEGDRFLKLRCVWFCHKEDLGDGICCSREGQEIWVAKYHSDHMWRHEVELYK